MRKLFWTLLLAALLALPAAAFDDVPEDHWAVDVIDRMAEAHVTTGYPDGTFRPGDEVSRGQFLAMLLRACGEDDVPLADDGESWWQPYLETADAAGLLAAGDGLPVFDGTAGGMNGPITRQEAAQLLCNAAGSYGGLTVTAGWERPLQFTDEIPARYADGIRTAAQLGLLSGYPDGAFRGEQSLDRAEACAVLARLMDQTRWLEEGERLVVYTGSGLIKLRLDDDGAATLTGIRLSDGRVMDTLEVEMDGYRGDAGLRREDAALWAETYGRTVTGADGAAFWGEIGYCTYEADGSFTRWTERAVLDWAADGGRIVAVSHRPGERVSCTVSGARQPAGDQVIRFGRGGAAELLLSNTPDHGLRLTEVTRIEDGAVYVAAVRSGGGERYEYAVESGRLRAVVHQPGDGFSGFTPEEAAAEQARLDEAGVGG